MPLAPRPPRRDGHLGSEVDGAVACVRGAANLNALRLPAGPGRGRGARRRRHAHTPAKAAAATANTSRPARCCRCCGCVSCLGLAPSQCLRSPRPSSMPATGQGGCRVLGRRRGAGLAAGGAGMAGGAREWRLQAPSLPAWRWLDLDPVRDPVSAFGICQGMSWQHLHQPVRLDRCNTYTLSLSSLCEYILQLGLSLI